MKKFLVATLAAVALLGFAGSSFALLCASDPVPAGTLLFPFVTAKYDATSTNDNPVADYNAPQTLFAVTNVSSTPHIVHFVLWNDFSYPALDWNVLLTGYDVITYNAARILEGWLVPTGPDNNAATGRPYSPTGNQPLAWGPIPSFWAGIPSLKKPGGVNDAAYLAYTDCKDATKPYPPGPVDTELQANRLPVFNLKHLTESMQRSETISQNGYWGNLVIPGIVDYHAPAWLLNRTYNDNVWGYVTADVVIDCTFLNPGSTGAYFNTYAPALTVWGWDSVNHVGCWPPAAACHIRYLGNVLIGDWFVVDPGNNGAQGNTAVHIEMDNQDVVNSVNYPKAVVNGASFYRYTEDYCYNDTAPNQLFPANSDDIPNCTDIYTGDSHSEDETTMGIYFSNTKFGDAFTLYGNSNDFREPLPTAFAFRWIQGGGFDGGTKIRVWKETTDVYLYYGLDYVYSGLMYSYYAWDEEEHVIGTTTQTCPVSPCDPGSVGLDNNNNLPLEIQEVDTAVFNLPTTYMTFGWMLLAFYGSAGGPTAVVNIVPDAYTGPIPQTNGFQAWVEVMYSASGKYSVDMSAAVLGNFLCDGLSVAAATPDGVDRTDLGDVLY